MSKSKKIILGSLFWVWQLTWGAIMTFIGLITAVVCISLGGKVHKNGLSFIVEIGENWGGISLGAISFCGNYSNGNSYWWNHIRSHEAGHSVQNLIFGPLFPFIIGLPSLFRSWYHTSPSSKNLQDYDYAWFEYTASLWGAKYISKVEGIDIQYTYKRVKKTYK